MKGLPEERAVECAKHIVETGDTVRQTAKKFNISKSTVHKDVTYRLPNVNKNLYKKVRKVLQINKEERHLRGGIATRKKYYPE